MPALRRIATLIVLSTALLSLISCGVLAEQPSTLAERPSSLASISMVSPTDGWAVGSVLLHFDGSTWQQVSSPVQAELASVAMVSASDGWAVGGDTIIHFDGHSWKVWQQVSGAQFFRVFAFSSNSAWAVGARLRPSDGAQQGLLLHFDGSGWQAEPLPSNIERLSDVVAQSPDNAWAAGLDEHSQLILLHYDGSVWSPVALPSGASWPASLALLAKDNGWVAGDPMLHFDGARWTRVLAPSSGEIGLIQGIDMLGPNDGWAICDSAILRFSGNQWVTQSAQEVDRLRGLAMISDSDGWVVGFRLVMGNQTVTHAVILHLTGGVWREVVRL
jgi:photosystem II stability/assembly factor-like uncharacterized protein